MVEKSSPASSFNARNVCRQHRAGPSKKRPLWLLSFYFLFIVACFNAVWTYQDQKELVRLRLEKENEKVKSHDGVDPEIHTATTSAGAEMHVVTTGVGSSQYGGSIQARKKNRKTFGTMFNGIRPKPSEGSNDYIAHHLLSNFEEFSFYITTDTPYPKAEEKISQSQMTELRDYVKNDSNRKVAFGIHLGGAQKASQCAESTYKNRADLIARGSHPTIVIPGKHDWFYCLRQEEAFGFFLEHLGTGLSSQWDKNQIETLDIKRSKQNPELVSFCVEGILFVGLHMIDPPANKEKTLARYERMEESMQWLAQSIEGNFAEREIRGVIILGHAAISERNESFFAHARTYFSGSSMRKNIPVLYLHGDGLSWKVDKTFSPFYDVQIEQESFVKPCIIDVAPQRKGKMKSLHRDKSILQNTILGKGLFRLDRQ